MNKDDFKIMVVDDEPVIVKLLTDNLASLTNHSITGFTDPYLAIQAFQKETFHLVLTDINMPNIDGFALLKQMNAHRPSSHFMVITAYKNIEVVARSMRLGASYIFYKPIDLEAVIAAVDTMFGRYLYWVERLNEIGGEK